jgi:hypothetical protein
MKKRELKFITCCPDDTYYTWQVHLWLESLKKLNKSKDAIVLIFTPITRNQNAKWRQIISAYPETVFKFYRDDKDEISTLYIPLYIPILRPWLMTQFLTRHPEFKNDALFYCDSDILFTDRFNIDDYVEDDTNYVSNTNSYINLDYFDSKSKDVLEHKKEEYKQLDVFSMLGSLIGIDREMGLKNNNHSGGAQYLLKNQDRFFWKKVMNDCITIRKYLQKINKDFFASESKGFQSWCADMWAVLWNLWLIEGSKTKIIKEMDFTWSLDPISNLKNKHILHNAGVTAHYVNDIPYFYKGKYHKGEDPTKDKHLDVVLKNEVTKKSCNWMYANALKELKEKYKFNY